MVHWQRHGTQLRGVIQLVLYKHSLNPTLVGTKVSVVTITVEVTQCKDNACLD